MSKLTRLRLDHPTRFNRLITAATGAAYDEMPEIEPQLARLQYNIKNCGPTTAREILAAVGIALLEAGQ